MLTGFLARAVAVSAAVLLTVSGCVLKRVNYPEAYGVYGFKNGAWVALGKVGGAISLEMPEKVRILVHDKEVGRMSRGLSVSRMVFIRNEITANPGGSEKRTRKVSEWERVGKGEKAEQRVEGRLLPVDGKPEMALWESGVELGYGAWVVESDGGSWGPFFVDKAGTLGGLETGASCFDKEKTAAWGIPMGVPDKLRPCGGDPTKALIGHFRENGSGASLARVTELLRAGASANGFDDYNAESVLGFAIAGDRKDLVELLLANGAKVNAAPNGSPELFSARSVGMAKLLIERGASAKAKAADGRGVLHVLGVRGAPPEVDRFMISKGAEVNLKSSFGLTPLGELLRDKRALMEAGPGVFKYSERVTAMALREQALREAGGVE